MKFEHRIIRAVIIGLWWGTLLVCVWDWFPQ